MPSKYDMIVDVEYFDAVVGKSLLEKFDEDHRDEQSVYLVKKGSAKPKKKAAPKKKAPAKKTKKGKTDAQRSDKKPNGDGRQR